MEKEISLGRIYKPSENVVARDIQGELIIIPIVSGLGNLEDVILTLNASGRAIWNKLGGLKTLKDIVQELAVDYNISVKEMKNDVIGLTKEFLKRKMIIEVKRG